MSTTKHAALSPTYTMFIRRECWRDALSLCHLRNFQGTSIIVLFPELDYIEAQACLLVLVMMLLRMAIKRVSKLTVALRRTTHRNISMRYHCSQTPEHNPSTLVSVALLPSHNNPSTRCVALLWLLFSVLSSLYFLVGFTSILHADDFSDFVCSPGVCCVGCSSRSDT